MELHDLLAERPSINRNSLLVRPIQFVSAILAIALIFGGLAFLFVKDIQIYLVELILIEDVFKLKDEAARQLVHLDKIIGFTMLAVGLFMLLVHRLTLYVVRRNLFILKLERWYLDKVEEARKEEEERLAAEEAAKE